MVRIIKKSKVAYFCLLGIPYKYENKTLTKLEPEDPYFEVMMAYSKLKDYLTENDGVVKYEKDGDVLEYEKDSLEYPQGLNEEEMDAITFMSESEDAEGDDTAVDLGDEIVSEEEVVDKKISTEDQEEIDLILLKLENINANIKKLESANINDDDDLQGLYLEEIGKKKTLEDRLAELGYDIKDGEKTVVDKLLENTNYCDFKKSSVRIKLIESHKMGSKVLAHTIAESKKRLLESIKKKRKFKESGVEINYHPLDGNFIFSGKIEKYTTEEILVVPESEFFSVFDQIIKEIDDVAKIEPSLGRVIEKEGFKLKETEEIEPEKLEDFGFYEAKTPLYKSLDGKISDVMTADSSECCRKGYVMQYVESSDTLVDEYGNTYIIDPKHLSKVEKTVASTDLVENETYDLKDDAGEDHTVTFEGVVDVEGEKGFEFKNRLKESLIMPKQEIRIRVRSRK